MSLGFFIVVVVFNSTNSLTLISLFNDAFNRNVVVTGREKKRQVECQLAP